MADEDFKVKIKGELDKKALAELEEKIKKLMEEAAEAGLTKGVSKIFGRILKQATTSAATGFRPTDLKGTKPVTAADQAKYKAQVEAKMHGGPTGDIKKDLDNFNKQFGGTVVKLEGMAEKVNATKRQFGEELIPDVLKPAIDKLGEIPGLKINRIQSGMRGTEDPLLSIQMENATQQKRMWKKLSDAGFGVSDAPEEFGLDITFNDTIRSIESQFNHLSSILSVTTDVFEEMSNELQKQHSNKYWEEQSTKVQSVMETRGGKSYEEWNAEQKEAAKRTMGRAWPQADKVEKEQRNFATFDPLYNKALMYFQNKRGIKMIEAYRKEMFGEAQPAKGGLGTGKLLNTAFNTRMFGEGTMPGKLEDIMKGGMKGSKGAFETARDSGEGLLGSLGAGIKGGIGGAKGAAGGLGPMIIVTAIQKIGEVIEAGVEILKKFWEFMVKSSPQLQATIKLTMRGIMLFIRPFGDLIAITMRPMARWLIRLNREAMQAGRAAGKPGSPEYLKAYMKSWSAGFMGGMMEELIKPLFTTIKELLPPLIETLTPLLVILVAAITPAIIAGIAMGFIQIFADFGAWIWGGLQGVADKLMATFLNFGQLMLSKIIETAVGIGNTLLGLGKWIWDQITGIGTSIWNAISGFGTWIWNQITGALSTLWDTISGFGKWLWDQITGAITGAIKGIGGGIQNVKNWLGLQEGGIVTSPTHALIGEHGPEAVIPLNKIGAMGGTTVTLNWTQKGAIYGVDDLEKTINRALDQYFRTKVTAR